MSGNKKIGIKLVSVVMLCLFTGIIANNILCNFAHAVDATGQEHDHPYGHDHHHGGMSPIDESDHKDKGHEHNQDASTGCCTDATFTFFSTLKRDHASTFTAKVIPISLPNIILAPKSLFKGVQIALPPKIPDIRVFIQSFQI